jgi:hypothetical protein
MIATYVPTMVTRMTDPKKGQDPPLDNTGQRVFERESRRI